ncbi:LysR family transcriptional regulator [Caballeronia sp. HLA56]
MLASQAAIYNPPRTTIKFKSHFKMNDLRPFVILAETVSHGSMSAAAARLGMSASAVSQAIKALERESGVTLLHRSTRKLTLTEDGERCYAHCLRLIEAWKAASESLAQARDAPTGELRVAAPIGFGSYIAPALAPVLSTWPKLRLRLLVSDEMVDLIDARVDIAIRVGKLADSGWVGRPLCELETILCASPAYLQRHGTPQSLQELTTHHWISLERELDESGQNASTPNDDAPSLVLDLQGDKRVKETVRAPVRIASTTQPTVQQICEQGLGIARLAYIDAQSSIKRRTLVHVLPDWRLPVLPVTLVSPKKSTEPAKVRAAVEALKAYFTRLPSTRDR